MVEKKVEKETLEWLSDLLESHYGVRKLCDLPRYNIKKEQEAEEYVDEFSRGEHS